MLSNTQESVIVEKQFLTSSEARLKFTFLGSNESKLSTSKHGEN